jgi:hypothetical protein
MGTGAQLPAAGLTEVSPLHTRYLRHVAVADAAGRGKVTKPHAMAIGHRPSVLAGPVHGRRGVGRGYSAAALVPTGTSCTCTDYGVG